VAEDIGDKTEAPTGKRLSDARGEGRVARSHDLASALDLLGGLIMLLIFGASITRACALVLRDSLTMGTSSLVGALSLESAWEGVRTPLINLAIALAPLFLFMVAIATLAHAGQFGLLWNMGSLQPKFERLNPVAGLSKLCNRRNAVKSLINFGKLIVVGSVAWLYASSCAHQVVALPVLTAAAAWSIIMQLVAELAAWLIAVLIVLGVTDFLFQRWQHTQDLKMTKHDVKDERRSMEGDPQIKGRRLKMARELVRQRIGSSVPQADVILTNPTHFSVAIKYDQEKMNAPRVIAKGADELAMSIRIIARAHGIPLIQRPPLARALYRHVQVGDEIQPQFYEAVAEVLAYVYRIEASAKDRASHPGPHPAQPLPVAAAA